ncbi:hypothetical protein WI99_16660 [Burkholderia cepacia]|nr:hypothetical protein WI99_16660 [Burkholderia cepacia]
MSRHAIGAQFREMGLQRSLGCPLDTGVDRARIKRAEEHFCRSRSFLLEKLKDFRFSLETPGKQLLDMQGRLAQRRSVCGEIQAFVAVQHLPEARKIVFHVTGGTGNEAARPCHYVITSEQHTVPSQADMVIGMTGRMYHCHSGNDIAVG